MSAPFENTTETATLQGSSSIAAANKLRATFPFAWDAWVARVLRGRSRWVEGGDRTLDMDYYAVGKASRPSRYARALFADCIYFRCDTR
jgi:hypothetical protein